MKTDLKPLLRLIPYLRPHVKFILASIVLAAPLAALRMAPAPFIKYVIDDVLVQKNALDLAMVPFIIVGIYVLNFVVRFFHYYFLRVVIARVNQNIKNSLFNHVTRLSLDHFNTQRTGMLISRVGHDPQNIDAGISCINVLVREPLTLLGLLGYSLYLNWKLTVVVFFIFPPLAFIFAATGRNLKRLIQKMAEENGHLYSTIQESLTGIRVVKLFGLEDYLRKKFEERSGNFAGFYLKTAVLEEAAHPAVELVTAFAIAAVIMIGGKEVVGGNMTPGDLLSFFGAFALLMNPLRELNNVNLKLNSTAASCQRIFEVMDWKSRILVPQSPQKLPKTFEVVEFQNVSFEYPDSPSRQVLSNICFRLKRGQVMALVGESGAGKSSIATLLTRGYDPTKGSIRINETDIREFSPDELRSQIAVVSQDVFLFNDTVLENIRCGKLDATRDEIEEAARKAHAWEYIQKLPNGFESIIGERGQKLSGGERQRLSIARAFLRNTQLLVLDEATSSLDSASERAVQEALDDLIQSRTTLVIAHRLTTIQNAHEIVVVRGGTVKEQGTHEELLGRDGEYRRLFETSSAGF